MSTTDSLFDDTFQTSAADRMDSLVMDVSVSNSVQDKTLNGDRFEYRSNAALNMKVLPFGLFKTDHCQWHYILLRSI